MSAEYALFSKEENEILTRTGPGTPMGKLLRRYWLPAIKSEEISVSGGDQLRLKLLGEDLIVFRSTDGRVGVLDQFCPHRRANLFFARKLDFFSINYNNIVTTIHMWRIRGLMLSS